MAVLIGKVHRDGPRRAGEQQQPGFDLAHLEHTVLQAVIDAIAGLPSRPLVVELHGFRRKRRRDLILSIGSAVARESDLPAAVTKP